jgi:hypothetical protein
MEHSFALKTAFVELNNMPEIQQRYCFTCGSVLGRKAVRRPGFNTLTGKPIIDVDLFCPRRKWWQLSHDIGIYRHVYDTPFRYGE